jgi:hypothetical protein
MIFIGSDVAGSTGLKSIYVIEFRRYKNSRPAGGGNFCLLAPFLLISQRFVPPKRRIETAAAGLIQLGRPPELSAKAICRRRPTGF